MLQILKSVSLSPSLSLSLFVLFLILVCWTDLNESKIEVSLTLLLTSAFIFYNDCFVIWVKTNNWLAYMPGSQEQLKISCCMRSTEPPWPNDWVFVYELSGSGFESSCSHINTTVFNNWLKTKIKIKICRQWFSLYIETFWCFTKFSFHHNWNAARLLLISPVYTSWLTSFQTNGKLLKNWN